MLGGEVGKSARLKRPGIAWNTFTHTVGEVGVELCRAPITVGKTWPVGDGLGRACDNTRSGLEGMGADCRFSTTPRQRRTDQKKRDQDVYSHNDCIAPSIHDSSSSSIALCASSRDKLPMSEAPEPDCGLARIALGPS